MKRRMTITIWPDVKDEEAIVALSQVIAGGRISKDDTCYCYVAKFTSTGITVYAETTKNGGDTFRIYRDYEATS